MRRKSLLRLLEQRDRTRFPRERDFAEALEIGPAHFSQMKMGVRGIGDDVADRIERALGLAPGAMDRAPDDASEARRRMLDLFDQLDEAGRRRLLHTAEYEVQETRRLYGDPADGGIVSPLANGTTQ